MGGAGRWSCRWTPQPSSLHATQTSPTLIIIRPCSGYVSTVGESGEAKRAALRKPKAGERLAAIKRVREIETFSASLEQVSAARCPRSKLQRCWPGRPAAAPHLQ